MPRSDRCRSNPWHGFTLTSDRAGVAWLGLLALALALLPWYKGAGLSAGPAASALAEALAGRGWLWPLIVAALALVAAVAHARLAAVEPGARR